MTVSQLRRTMVAGMAFVLLFVGGVFLTFGDTPEIKSSDTAVTAAAKWTLELSQSSHRVGLLIGGFVLWVTHFDVLASLANLRSALQKFADGDYAVKLPTSRKDERYFWSAGSGIPNGWSSSRPNQP